MADGILDGAPKKRKGRTPFLPTDEQRALVRSMVGEGATAEAIAAAIGCSEPTLRKVCAEELADKLAASDNLFSATATDAPAAAPAPRRDGRGKGGGRPAFKPAYGDGDRVMEMVSVGMDETAIARTIGCSLPVYRRTFKTEIARARQVKLAEVIGFMFKAARKGSVPAQARLVEMMERARLAELDQAMHGKTGQPGTRPAAPRVETTPLGKKLQADQAAREELLTGEWADVLGTGAVDPEQAGRPN